MYERLQEATPEELLEAAIPNYIKHMPNPHEAERLMRLGFALAQEDGWRHVAPAWLQEVKNG